MAGPTMHQVRLRDSLDRAVFLATFLIGTIGTVLLKLVLSEAGPLILAAFPVAVLSAYALYCALRRASAIEPETAGDNCYYLGFLFTLASLAVTLYQVNRGADDVGNVVDIADVISGFGIALTSTISGVLLRVLFFQMRPDLVAADREARSDLSRSVRDFRQQLATISRELKGVSTEFSQHVSERNTKLIDLIEAQQNRSDEDLKSRLAAIADAFDDMPAAFSEQFATAIRDGVSSATQEVAEASAGLNSALSALASMQETGTNAVAASSKSLTEGLDQFEGATQAFKTRLEETSETLAIVSQKLADNQNRIDDMLAQLDRRLSEQRVERRWWQFHRN